MKTLILGYAVIGLFWLVLIGALLLEQYPSHKNETIVPKKQGRLWGAGDLVVTRGYRI